MNDITSIIGPTYAIGFTSASQKLIKRRLLGFCGIESVKTREEIVCAFKDLTRYRGGQNVISEVVDLSLARGYFPYLNNGQLNFTRLFDDDDDGVERYRVKLENSRAG